MRWLLVILTGLLTACNATTGPARPSEAHDDTARLLTMMTGSFSSQAQSEADDAYFDIRLEMVPIWTERDDGPWLYVEQAAASRLDEPYRQRVYRLSRAADGRYVSTVYEIPYPQSHAGAWRDARPLATLTPADLAERPGCAVYLTLTVDRFSGRTRQGECKSLLRNASYATSEVDISSRLIRSWDRGYDASGAQVWGAKKGPYRFVRIR